MILYKAVKVVIQAFCITTTGVVFRNPGFTSQFTTMKTGQSIFSYHYFTCIFLKQFIVGNDITVEPTWDAVAISIIMAG